MTGQRWEGAEMGRGGDDGHSAGCIVHFVNNL